MKLNFKALVCFGLLASTGLAYASDCSSGCSESSSGCSPCSVSCSADSSCSSSEKCGNAICKTKLLPFSQGENRARDYAAVAAYQYLPDQDEINWHADIAIEFQQNFRRDRLGAYFFPNGTNTITVGPNGGAGVDVRNVDIGLSDTFYGTLTIKPRIRNVIAEPQLYVGLDRWVEGLWFWTKLPITNTRWKLDCCETDTATGGQFFATASEMQSTGFTLAPAFGQSNQIQLALAGDLTWGDKVTGLGNGKFICCETNKTAIADIPFHLGYNFVNREAGYLGVYARVVFPTGRFKNEQAVFEPQIGYNRWQLGGGVNGGWRLYEHDEDTSLHLIGDVYATYMFKKTECRLFDLKANGCFSRYLLMKETDANGNFTGRLANFADIFSACVESKINWNIDALVFLEARHKGWSFDLGYEFKARAKEKFEDCNQFGVCDACEDSCSNSCCTVAATALDSKQYGIKGTSLVGAIGSPITTQSTSTIAVAGPTDATPVLINSTNFSSKLDLCNGAIPQALSHKVWGNFAYAWQDLDYPVYLGVGAEGEFGHKNKAISLWGVWAKAGVTYY